MNELSSLHSPLSISTQSHLSSGFESARSTGRFDTFRSGDFTLQADAPLVSMEMEGERLRREMHEYNSVLQEYAENVGFLKVQTKLLEDKHEERVLEKLALKDEYEGRLSAARDLVEKVKDEKAHLEVEVENLERKMDQAHKELTEAQRWRDEDLKTISELEEKIAILEVRLENNPMIADRQRDKETIDKLESDVKSLAQDFLHEMNSRLEAENRVHTLSEELKFLKTEHEQCLKRLAILEARETDVMYSEFWKKELGQIRAYVRADFEAELETRERNHNFQVQELQTRLVHLDGQLSRSREQMEVAQKQLSLGEADKAHLENEVSSLKNKIDSFHDLQNQNDDLQDQVEKLVKLVRQMLTIQSEVSTFGKTLTGLSSLRPDLAIAEPKGTPLSVSTTTHHPYATFQTTGGDVSIADVDTQGKYIVIKNNSSKDVKLANWTLKREVQGSEPLIYKFPPSAVVMAGKTLKVWSNGYGSFRGANDLVFFGAKSWGVGDQTTTTLYKDTEKQSS